MSDSFTLALKLYAGGGLVPGDVAMPCPCSGCMTVVTAPLPRALQILGEHLGEHHRTESIDRLVPEGVRA